MSRSKECVNCAYWAELTDMDAEIRKGECGITAEHETRVVGFVRLKMQDKSAMEALTYELSQKLGIEKVDAGFVTYSDHYCASFSERELTDEELEDREGEEWKGE